MITEKFRRIVFLWIAIISCTNTKAIFHNSMVFVRENHNVRDSLSRKSKNQYPRLSVNIYPVDLLFSDVRFGSEFFFTKRFSLSAYAGYKFQQTIGRGPELRRDFILFSYSQEVDLLRYQISVSPRLYFPPSEDQSFLAFLALRCEYRNWHYNPFDLNEWEYSNESPFKTIAPVVREIFEKLEFGVQAFADTRVSMETRIGLGVRHQWFKQNIIYPANPLPGAPSFYQEGTPKWTTMPSLSWGFSFNFWILKRKATF